jgi:hypothetical protein
MTTIVQPIRIEEGVHRLVTLKSKEEHISKSDVLRQFVYKGIEDYALHLCQIGRIHISDCATLLNTSVWDILEMAKERHIALGPSDEQVEASTKTVDKIINKLKKQK